MTTLNQMVASELGKRLQLSRTDRPNEWQIDEFTRMAEQLQQENTILKAELHAKEIEELEDIEREDIDLNDFEQLKANLNKIKADAIREMVGENLTIARLRNDKKRSFVFASDAMEYANNLEGK